MQPGSVPSVGDRTNRRRSWLRIVLLVLAIAAMLPATRDTWLRALGDLLVAHDPMQRTELVAVTLHAGAAGVLEAADLVNRGVATPVAVFAEPPRPLAREFARRGVPYEDATARQLRQLADLGVARTVVIAGVAEAGSHGEAAALAAWCRAHRVASVTLVTSRDHSRRLRRVMGRALAPVGVALAVQPASHSDFDPAGWWRSNDGRRIFIVESQKLVLDWLGAPFAAAGPALADGPLRRADAP